MHIIILGTGAMGSLFAARLHHLVDVTMVGTWSAQLAAVQRHGLMLVHPDGRQTNHRFTVSREVQQCDPAEIVFVLVKSWQTERAAQQAAHLLTADGIALTLQNGLGNYKTLVDAVGPSRATLGVTSEGATMIAPGTVRHAGHGQTHLVVDSVRERRIGPILKILRQAGFEVGIVAEAQSLQWGKLAVNAGINPLTALLQVPNGFLADNESAREIMEQTAEEAATVADALGINLPYPSASQRALEVALATATNRSSMAQDLARGAPTEIDAICGAIVQHGSGVMIPTPFNQALLHLVRTAVAGKPWQAELPTVAADVAERLQVLIHQRQQS
ncbi:MAG: 2-dehydropantoate 2-reductase [Candidatus Promineifilaceae bacterium]|nr:2-dehydropantoate 2-reductase [Candidatus Promineifilaceae bacterium]